MAHFVPKPGNIISISMYLVECACSQHALHLPASGGQWPGFPGSQSELMVAVMWHGPGQGRLIIQLVC